MSDSDRKRFMREAIRLSRENVEAARGGPFGAVIVRDHEIVARGVNQVTMDQDPTAHAEVVAIREASRVLGDYRLHGCEIYCSCEPCPMCLGAIYWARLDAVWFGNSKEDAAAIEFDDHWIYEELASPFSQRALPTKQLLRDEAQEAFQAWASCERKTEY